MANELERLNKRMEYLKDKVFNDRDEKAIKEWAEIQQKLSVFKKKVDSVLEENFKPEHYRYIYSILMAIPDGTLNFMFDTWVNILSELNLVK